MQFAISLISYYKSYNTPRRPLDAAAGLRIKKEIAGNNPQTYFLTGQTRQKGAGMETPEQIQSATRAIMETICERTIAGDPMTLAGIEADDLELDYETWAGIIESLAAPDVAMIEGIRYTPERFYIDDVRATRKALQWYASYITFDRPLAF